MKETVFRRYKRLLAEEQTFPQLVIIDGGKGQLNAAVEAFEELNAKVQNSNDRSRQKTKKKIFFPGDKESLKLPYNSNSLKLIRRYFGMKCIASLALAFIAKKEAKELLKMNWKRSKELGKIQLTCY